MAVAAAVAVVAAVLVVAAGAVGAAVSAKAGLAAGVTVAVRTAVTALAAFEFFRKTFILCQARENYMKLYNCRSEKCCWK